MAIRLIQVQKVHTTSSPKLHSDRQRPPSADTLLRSLSLYCPGALQARRPGSRKTCRLETNVGGVVQSIWQGPSRDVIGHGRQPAQNFALGQSTALLGWSWEGRKVALLHCCRRGRRKVSSTPHRQNRQIPMPAARAKRSSWHTIRGKKRWPNKIDDCMKERTTLI